MQVKQKHEVRIIGGQYKGKKLPVLDIEGLRPTTDRIRETVFSWIAPYIENAVVLDLFAGSGALGFESFSRGADDVTLIELNRQNYNNLLKIKEDFASPKIKILNEDALQFVRNTDKKFDIIFIDPPYKSDLLKDVIPLLLSKDLLKDSSILYVEMNSAVTEAIPGFEVIKEEVAGMVKYGIWKKSSFLF